MSEEKDSSKPQIGKLGRAKEWILPKLAWFISIQLFVAFLFIAFRLPGGGMFMVFSNLFFILLFVPLYFFTKRTLVNPLIPHWVSVCQGIAFIFISFGIMAKIQHYPGATISVFFGNIGVFLIVIWLINQGKKFRIRKPIYLGLLVGVTFLTLNQFTQKIIENDYISSSGVEKNATFLQSYNDSLKSKIKAMDQFEIIKPLIDKIDSIEIKLIASVEHIPLSVADTLRFSSIHSIQNYDVTNTFLVGPDLKNPVIHKYSARVFIEEFKEVLISINIYQGFENNPLIKETTWSNEKFLKKNFYHSPLGHILLLFESYKSLLFQTVYLNSKADIGELNDLDIYLASNLNNKITDFHSEGTKEYSSKGSIFFGMFTFSLFLSIIFFFIPTFKISDKWKMRLILFSIVILFEFLLLVIDTYTGLLSNNLLSVLMVNIVLAFLLVGADNYVRNNMLAWYKEEEN